MTEPTTAADELRSWARGHAALRAGRGNVDDVLAFADWIEAEARQQDAHGSEWEDDPEDADAVAITEEGDQQDGSALRTALERLVALFEGSYNYAESSEALDQANAALAALPPSAPPALDVDPNPKIDPYALDVERLARAEHFWCVQVEGEWALGHEWTAHEKQAAYILVRLQGPER